MAITEAKTDAEKTEMASKDFLGLLGSVSYITLKTRPDCQFHVARIGQCSANPSPAAYEALVVVLTKLPVPRSTTGRLAFVLVYSNQYPYIHCTYR